MRSQEEIVPGRLVAFEGIDRAGKSSVIRLLPGLLKPSKIPIITCGEKLSPIKSLLGGEALREMSLLMKTYLFATDRAWTYEGTCLPALRRGELVLWDRYVDSAIVYRSVEITRGPSDIDLNFVEEINRPFLRPHLTIYLDVAPETSLARALRESAREPYDTEFLAAARVRYLELAKSEDYEVVDGERAIDVVAKDVAASIRKQFKEMF
jgi:dTMP kinase